MKYRWSKRKQKMVPVRTRRIVPEMAMTRQDFQNMKHLKAIGAKAKERQLSGLKQYKTTVPQNSAKREIDTRDELARIANVSHDTIMKVKAIGEVGVKKWGIYTIIRHKGGVILASIYERKYKNENTIEGSRSVGVAMVEGFTPPPAIKNLEGLW